MSTQFDGHTALISLVAISMRDSVISEADRILRDPVVAVRCMLACRVAAVLVRRLERSRRVLLAKLLEVVKLRPELAAADSLARILGKSLR